MFWRIICSTWIRRPPLSPWIWIAGNADFAIAIRTALMRSGTAYVQAGGGVVADSNGPYEYNEATNKAKAVLSAIAAAETLTSAADPQ